MSDEPIWVPPADVLDHTRIGAFARLAEQANGRSVHAYGDLWQWSVDEPSQFWTAIWDYFDFPYSGDRGTVLAKDTMPSASWFPDVELNYAEAMLHLAGREDADVIVRARSESRPDFGLTVAELRDLVGRARVGLIAMGIGRGDRVAAYLPNVPETLVLMLATASLGAVWTVCPPEFGVVSTFDRLEQVQPSALFVVDGYRYRGRDIDRRSESGELAEMLGLVEQTVVLPYLYPDTGGSTFISWTEFLPDVGSLVFDRVPFDHPLWVLYSSGTTGPPKSIVHGHGGITVELSKMQGLQHDLKTTDTYFWFTTTGWVMWNVQICGLLAGASIVLFDGDPGGRDMGELWMLAADMGVTFFGASAPFLMQSSKVGVNPRDWGDLDGIREIGVTGAPFPPEGYAWVASKFGPQLKVTSTSGGTDVVTSFVGGAPNVPVWAGGLSCRQLGARVEAWDDEGKPLTGTVGELVVTAPMPSMPVGFWGDESGERLRSAYFSQYSEVWRHGDWITIHEDGHCVISGRSDATLNRGGVRLGTAEFYRVIEAIPWVADSLVVHLESTLGDVGQLLLFVACADGRELDDVTTADLAKALRAQLSPRHVPDRFIQVPQIPRTLSGKKLEVPVKRILLGAEPDSVADRRALSNPTSLDAFVNFRSELESSKAESAGPVRWPDDTNRMNDLTKETQR